MLYLYKILVDLFFFFSSRRRHTRWTGDWSSDVCSSDLGVTPRPRRAPLPPGGRDAAKALKGTREVWFAEIGGWRNTSVLDRAKLLSGNVIGGPAIVEEHDASTLVHPGWEATVDQHGNLVVRTGM